MRVVHVAACPYPSPQGSQVYVRGLVRALARDGVDVTVVAYGHGSGPADAGYRVIRAPKVPGYQRLRSGPDPVKPALDLALTALVARLPADVVHAHNHEGLAIALAARLHTGIPVVYSAHTLLEEELPTYLCRGRRAARVIGAVADRTLPPRADATIALSERGARRLRELGCPGVRTIPPGVDPGDLRDARPVAHGRPTLVYAGNPDAYQDLPVLYAALPHLGGVRVVLATFAREPIAAPPGVEVCRVDGWPEVRDLLAGADAAVVPRTRCGGFPVKLLMSLALGVPTVVARGSAQGVPGEIVVADGDPVALAAGVRRAMVGPRPDPSGWVPAWSDRARSAEVRAVYESARERAHRR